MTALLAGLLAARSVSRQETESHPFGSTRASRVHPRTAPADAVRPGPRRRRRLRLCTSPAAAVRSHKLRDAAVVPHPCWMGSASELPRGPYGQDSGRTC